MFRRFFAAVLSLIPECWRIGHCWREETLKFDPPRKAYSMDRVCDGCGRRERRKLIRGQRSGDLFELIPDPFTDWERVRSQ